MSEPKHPKTDARDDESEDPKEPKKKPSGIDYVFKIAPADPKNNFDFEDVADK